MIKEARVTYSSNSDREDIKFWSSKTFEERLSAVQTLREQYISLFNKQEEYDESRKRLRRVYRIITLRSKADLIKNKLSTHRLKDKADAEELQQS